MQVYYKKNKLWGVQDPDLPDLIFLNPELIFLKVIPKVKESELTAHKNFILNLDSTLT